jgi:F0F1-type ATP synthase assembly protein I
MSTKIRSFPRTRNEPRKRILLIPVVLLVAGTILSFIYPFQFIGTILALTGVLTIFLVGMVFADLWASARRTKQIIKEREKRGLATSEEALEEIDDPFEELLGADPHDNE